MCTGRNRGKVNQSSLERLKKGGAGLKKKENREEENNRENTNDRVKVAKER